MKETVFEWRRGPRSSFSLGHDVGVYALFLREGATLPSIEPGKQGLLYIGLAAGREGLEGRCHFDARTRNHSLRKSLAVLLMDELGLKPVLIPKPNSPDTWGLDASSEKKLTDWMHDNLDLAIEIDSDPDSRETELLGLHAPPLNLTKCVQTPQHQLISEARAKVKAALQGSPAMQARHAAAARSRQQPSPLASRFVGANMDTAEAIAERYGLDPKSYRGQLRKSISWHRESQPWTVDVDSREWRDMIAVAERMTH